MTKTNCPNCGAPAKGLTCEYCGTPLESPRKALSLAIGKVVSVSFEHDGRLYEFDMVLEGVETRTDFCSVGFRPDGELTRTVHGTPEYKATLNGLIVPSVKHGSECLLAYRDLFPEEITC